MGRIPVFTGILLLKRSSCKGVSMKDFYQDKEYDMADTKPFRPVPEPVAVYRDTEKLPEEEKDVSSQKDQRVSQNFEGDSAELMKEEEVLLSEEEVEDFQGQESLGNPSYGMKEKSNESSFFVGLRDWVLPLVVALALALIIRMFIGGPTTVKGQSMESTLHSGDILLVSKIPTYSGKFKRADIIIMDSPTQPGELYVKRIVGLPGETVEIKGGHVFINNKLLKEYYIRDLPTGTYQETVWQLGEDEFFVMGDNREEDASSDSRLFGPVKAEKIEAVARFRIFPLSNLSSFY